MLERLLIAAALLALGFVVYRVIAARQVSKAASTATTDPLLADVPSGVATLVYFTTPTCLPCKTQQTPNLERLKADLGDRLHVVRVDATEDPAAADRWGVFSVPTTFVLGSDGTPRIVHNGVVSPERLKQDLGLAG